MNSPISTAFERLTHSRERILAESVLRQASADLRRFRHAPDGAGRELYRDALSWFQANDPDWPYSFVNACQVLDLSAESVLDEVMVDAASSWYSHSRRVAGRIAASVKVSMAALCAACTTQPLTVAKS